MESPPKFDFWIGGQFLQDPGHDSESLRLWNGDSESKRQALSPVSHPWFRVTTSKSVGWALIDTSDLNQKAILNRNVARATTSEPGGKANPMPKAIHHFDSESQPPTPNCSLSRFRIKPRKSAQRQKQGLFQCLRRFIIAILNHNPRLQIVHWSDSESNPWSHLRTRKQGQFQCLGSKAIRHFHSESHLYASLSLSFLIVHTFGHQAHAFGHQVHISGTNTREKLQGTLSGTKCTLWAPSAHFRHQCLRRFITLILNHNPQLRSVHWSDSESNP